MKIAIEGGARFLTLLLVSAGIACSKTSSPLPGDPPNDIEAVKKSAAAMWAAEDFSGLERLAEQCRAENFDVLNSCPAISFFYSAICGEAASDEAAAVQFDKLRRWLAAAPSSVTVRIALAHHFTSDAWRARGGDWASTVSSDNWRLFHERILKAREAIYSNGVRVEDDPTVAALRITIAMTGEYQPGEKSRRFPLNAALWTSYLPVYFVLPFCWSYDRGRTDLETAYAQGIKAWPGYFPIYFNMQWAVLPRWGGITGDGAKLAEKAVAPFAGDTADGLYTLLANAVFEPEGMESFKTSGFDILRYLKGMDVLARRAHGSWRPFWTQRAAYLEAIAGDPSRARQRIFAIGPNTIPSAYVTQDEVATAWKKCGAMAELERGTDLEHAGQLDDAEAFYAGLNSDNPNPWILSFALRNGVQRLWKPLYGTTSLSPKGADPNQLFELATFHLCAGNLREAKVCAEAFDAVRPWNITGKYTLAFIAAVEGDREGFAKIREKFLSLKTDRKNYGFAQRYAAGELKWEEAREQMATDEFFIQACSAMAAFAIGDGRPGEAKLIFETIHKTFPFQTAVAFPESMLWGTLSRKYPLGREFGDTKRTP